MEDYFVLTFSKNIDDILEVSNAVKVLQDAFPDKSIIALPETINFQDYTKEELIERLKYYINYMEKIINE